MRLKLRLVTESWLFDFDFCCAIGLEDGAEVLSSSAGLHLNSENLTDCIYRVPFFVRFLFVGHFRNTQGLMSQSFEKQTNQTVNQCALWICDMFCALQATYK